MADLMSAGPNGPCPYPGELSVTLAPQILDLHYNATPPQSLSLLVHWCTGAPTDLSMLSAICSKSQGHAIQSRLSQGVVGWVRVLGEWWMCVG